MGTKASSFLPARSEELSQDIKQLNDSVYELYAPPEGVPPQVAVILFHGLPLEDDYKEAYWKTWKSRDGKVVWPKDWLPEDLPNPWILSVSYDSYALKHDGSSDSYIIAENLISNIVLHATRVGQDCPVVLVGHSLGGIIIKEFLLACLNKRGLLSNSAKDKLQIDKFLENCKGVFYYSTPHHGSEFFNSLGEGRVPLNGPLMKLLKILSSETARINHQFANARIGEGIMTEAILENLDTTYMGFKGRIVKEASARHDIKDFYTAHDANHFDVCKPKNKTWCNIYRNLLRFIETAMEEKRRGLGYSPDYVSTGSRACPSQIARAEGPLQINPVPMEIDQRTQGIKKLNDSVYQLYTPRQSAPRVLVIFFHGLPQEDEYREAYRKTWLSHETAAPRVVWPREWLPKHLPSPKILSVSYDSSARKHDGASDFYLIAENLIQDIILGRDRLGQDCPVVLVGHSLGGIIIKALLLACLKMRGQLSNDGRATRATQSIENFLQNCKGVFYYSTPHEGSKFIDRLAKSKVALNDPLMKLLMTLNSCTARINYEFENARLGKNIRTQAIGETSDTTYMGLTGRIVDEASARRDVDAGRFYAASHVNHFEICQAKNHESCNIFTLLLEFIRTAIEDKGPGLRASFTYTLPAVVQNSVQNSTKQVYKT